MQERYKNLKKKYNIWIVKPGETTNRGYGISIHDDYQSVFNTVNSTERYADGKYKTYII